MDKSVFLIASFLVLFALVQINAEIDDDVDDFTRQERGFLFKVNSSWYAAYKNFTATKLMKNTALITSFLNSSSLPFKTKKIALLSSLTNATVSFIIPKANSTAYKLMNKASKLTNSTLSFFNASSTLINSLLSAKLSLKNNTYLAKLQFLNASGIALQTALSAKTNSTNKKLLYLLNSTSTSPWGLKLKKNFSLLWADELGDIYNFTAFQNELLVIKLNKTYLKNNDDDFYDDNNDMDTYEIGTNEMDTNEMDTNEMDTNEMHINEIDTNGDQYQYPIEYEFEYE